MAREGFMESDELASRRRRLRRWLWLAGLGCVAVVAALAVGWAAASVLTPAADPLEATDFTYVSVATGEVGSSISLNTVAEWSPVPVGSNLASGVVTGSRSLRGMSCRQGRSACAPSRWDYEPVFRSSHWSMSASSSRIFCRSCGVKRRTCIAITASAAIGLNPNARCTALRNS